MKTLEDLKAMKPSELLRMALKDAKEWEAADPNHLLYMGVWYKHPEEGDDHCYTCLAGAVMIQELGWELKDFLQLGGVVGVNDVMQSLDYFRQGSIEAGLACLGHRATDQLVTDFHDEIYDEYGWCRHGRNKEKWFEQMYQMADLLERHGL